MTDSANLAGGASWFPYKLDLARNTLSFAQTDLETLLALTMVNDGEWIGRGVPSRTEPLNALLAQLGDPTSPRLNYIWHTAFCCSTLLSRAIDRADRNLTLREPEILVTLASAKRSGSLASRARERLPELVFRLLARRFGPDCAISVKPAPASNYLIRDAAAQTDGKMIFLYSDCASYVAAIGKRGSNGGSWVRLLSGMILGDGNDLARWAPERLFVLSDLQLAAVVWHWQIAEFRRSWPALAPGRAASLDCDIFTDRPEETLGKVDAFLGLGLGRDHIAKTVAGPLFAQHAKLADTAYSPAQRRQDRESLDEGLKFDVEAVVEWSYEMFPETPKGAPLPNPLLA